MSDDTGAGGPIRVIDRAVIARHGDTSYRFPRLNTTNDGTLVLFYRVGLTHMNDTGGIAMRTSTSGGAEWSRPKLVHVDPDGYSANNVVECMSREGGIQLFISRYNFFHRHRLPLYRRWSADGGMTWSDPELFDEEKGRSSYYMTDVIRTSDGLLGCMSTFVSPGVQPCYNLMWHSDDDGTTWSVRSQLTRLEENLGDEVAMIELSEGNILLLLRDRRRTGVYRVRSEDGGRTWGERTNLGEMLGVLQRPLLRSFGDGRLFLSGRDFKTKEVVAFVSEDGGERFHSRTVVDDYQRDGAYTGAAILPDGNLLLVYYGDKEEREQPDLHQAVLDVDL